MTVKRPLVAVVDDDESVRESLPDLLRELGYSARAFSSAEEFEQGTVACLLKPFSDTALFEALNAAFRVR